MPSKPDDVFADELPATLIGMSTDDDFGMLAFGFSSSALVMPSGSESAASVKPWFTSELVSGVLLLSVNNHHTAYSTV